jgi:hypothetical protein
LPHRIPSALTLALAVALSACTAAGASRDGSTGRDADRVTVTAAPDGPAGAPAPAVRAEPAAPPTPASPYEPAAGEADPAAKRLGALVAQRLTTYETSDALADVVARVIDDPVRRAALAAAAEPLFHAGRWSRGTVVYPQMGGLTADRASIMVVTRQDVGVGAVAEVTETRTLDVRLVRGASGWVFDELASAGGVPVPRPADLAPDAARVVDDPRITLPDSARWDIYAGRISGQLLAVMASLAEQTAYGVAVLETGHPVNVFETTRQSAHTRGYAVDVYAIGGALVIDERAEGSRTRGIVGWLHERGDVVQIGSPWDLGAGNRSFTNAVHQDHVHIAA